MFYGSSKEDAKRVAQAPMVCSLRERRETGEETFVAPANKRNPFIKQRVACLNFMCQTLVV